MTATFKLHHLMLPAGSRRNPAARSEMARLVLLLAAVVLLGVAVWAVLHEASPASWPGSELPVMAAMGGANA